MRSGLNQTQLQLSEFSVPEPHLSAVSFETGCWTTHKCLPCVLSVLLWCRDGLLDQSFWICVSLCYPLIHLGSWPACLPSCMPRNCRYLYSFSKSLAVVFSVYCWPNVSHFSESIWKLSISFDLSLSLGSSLLSDSLKQPGGAWSVIRDVESVDVLIKWIR